VCDEELHYLRNMRRDWEDGGMNVIINTKARLLEILRYEAEQGAPNFEFKKGLQKLTDYEEEKLVDTDDEHPEKVREAIVCKHNDDYEGMLKVDQELFEAAPDAEMLAVEDCGLVYL
jgi:hypothetical protein